ncbi:unnamed protein product, partial [Schistosoma intercalatum]
MSFIVHKNWITFQTNLRLIFLSFRSNIYAKNLTFGFASLVGILRSFSYGHRDCVSVDLTAYNH